MTVMEKCILMKRTDVLKPWMAQCEGDRFFNTFTTVSVHTRGAAMKFLSEVCFTSGVMGSRKHIQQETRQRFSTFLLHQRILLVCCGDAPCGENPCFTHRWSSVLTGEKHPGSNVSSRYFCKPQIRSNLCVSTYHIDMSLNASCHVHITCLLTLMSRGGAESGTVRSDTAGTRATAV